MALVPMKHIIVVLPGITGSVLRKDGKRLWDAKLLRFAGAIFGSLEGLELKGDDPTCDDLGDGVDAPELIKDLSIFPGLIKIDIGYGALTEQLKQTFDLKDGKNFFEFPYDWRRDNRVAARKLQQLVEKQLPLWRQESGAADAQVILLAHSMGGVISRYYLEVLGGWKTCKLLVTFGTPYLGSLNSLDSLSNDVEYFGIKFKTLSRLGRSCTSIYQLLPIYPVVQSGGTFHQVSDLTLPNIDQVKAQEALAFHREIIEAQKANQKDMEYLAKQDWIVPWVGTKQKTFQSATFDGATVTCVDDVLPDAVDQNAVMGDGTVPYCSARPYEHILQKRLVGRFRAEKHGSLQNDVDILNDLFSLLTETSSGAVIDIGFKEGLKSALSLDVPDVSPVGAPVPVETRLFNCDDELTLEAVVTPTEGTGKSSVTPLKANGDRWSCAIENLQAGYYRIEVRSSKWTPNEPLPVHDVFAVIQPSDAQRE